MLNRITSDLHNLANRDKAKVLSGFFKTGKGEYGEGDIFLGITVPEQRKVAGKYSDMPLKELHKLLSGKIHEHRLTALLILVLKFQRGNDIQKTDLYDFYVKHIQHVNNWDLVDLSADKILGAYLLDKDKSLLYRMTKSESVWERRISIVSTFHFIKNHQFEDTFRISELLLNDGHDLIHKAVGWMLREAGKRDLRREEQFLKKHSQAMPRTMLRYAIEKFDEKKRLSYLKK